MTKPGKYNTGPTCLCVKHLDHVEVPTLQATLRPAGAQVTSPQRLRRSSMVAAVGVLTLALVACAPIYRTFGGAFRGEPSEMEASLSAGAKQLIRDAFRGIDPSAFSDVHVHMISRSVHPDWISRWHPLKRARSLIYLSAAGVEPSDSLETDYVARTVSLARAFPPGAKFHLLAMDRYYREDGTADVRRTPYYVANELVVEISRRHPDVFVPVVSIHPYRKDALVELEKWAREGCRYVKWLPNSQGMDPASDRVEGFYRKMRQLGMVLFTHTGKEDAVDAENQELGNPLRLRKPLDIGVRVVALHAGSRGESIDLDDPDGRKVASYDLFLRLMADPKYERLLFGEIAAITFYDRVGGPLLRLLEDERLHRRLVNGSDYPLPGIAVVIQTSQLARKGLISHEERKQLDEIYAYNPLLFDFIVKRTVRHPKTGERFPSSVFMMPRMLQ